MGVKWKLNNMGKCGISRERLIVWRNGWKFETGGALIARIRGTFGLIVFKVILVVLFGVFVTACSSKTVGRRGGSQAWSGLSASQDHITDCKLDSVVHAGVCGCKCGELFWTCLFGPNDLGPTVVGCHRLRSATGEQKGTTQAIILTPSRPVALPIPSLGLSSILVT